MSIHKMTKQREEMVGETQRFCLWYKYRRVRHKGEFFPVRLVRTHYKRNYFILQYIITIFPVGESFGGMFKCFSMDVVEGELFHFQLLFINCEIVLTC